MTGRSPDAAQRLLPPDQARRCTCGDSVTGLCCYPTATCPREEASSAAPVCPLGPLHVKQGVNSYEWFVYEGMVLVSPRPLPTQREAVAWMDGYEEGRTYDPS